MGGVWKTSGTTQTWKTLKKTPKFDGKPAGYANSQTYFDLSVKVEDKDEAVTGYTWEIRDQENKGERIETLTSTKPNTSLYIGPTKDGKNKIEKGLPCLGSTARLPDTAHIGLKFYAVSFTL